MDKQEFIDIWSEGGDLSEYGKKHMVDDLNKVMQSVESDLATARADLLRYQSERDALLARIEELVAELRECMNANTLSAQAQS